MRAAARRAATVRQRTYQREYRQRQKHGVEMRRVAISRDVLEALLISTRCSEADLFNAKKVSGELADVLQEWAARWLDK